MFREAVIHYPTNTADMNKISKELAAFRCSAAIRYIESLHLSDRQIETLYTCLAEEIAVKEQKIEIA